MTSFLCHVLKDVVRKYPEDRYVPNYVHGGQNQLIAIIVNFCGQTHLPTIKLKFNE